MRYATPEARAKHAAEQRLYRLRHPGKAVEDQRRWREAHPERKVELSRRWFAKHRVEIKEGHKKWIKNNAEKHRVHRMVDNAVQRGTLSKPGKCSICGKTRPLAAIHAYHADYSKPFEIVWTCHGCHPKLDAERRRNGK